jgi:leader peptidase (prepilin peptidase)/N-methyltransferase
MIEELGAPLVYGSALAFGLVMGSFLNVAIHRLPRGESVVSPRSRCPGCKRAISARDNIPVISYLLLGGKCRYCQQPISIRYPAVELLTGLLFVASVWGLGATPMALVFMGFSSAMVVVSFVDFDHQIIPDEISLGGLVLGLVLVPVVHSLQPGVSYWSELGASALGAAIGAGLLWSVGFLHARLSVALGRSFPHWPGEGEPIPRPGDADYWLWFPGLGLGDVKLLAMIGAFLGPWGVFDTLLLASLIGLVVGVAWGVAQRNWSSPFGFGPALASGALLSLYAPPHEAWLRALVAGSGAGC